jgi:putative hydrolase of HD superfamily
MTSYYNTGKVRSLGDHKILNLGQIIRYNNRAKIKNENVAEHSFYVIATVLKIVKMFNLSDEVKYKALEFATVHDIPEMFTGDMPYDTKVSNPELAALLTIAEINELEKNMPEYLDAYKQLVKEEEEETISAIVTKLADTVSVLQYSNLELELGNKTHDMRSINEGAQERVSALVEKLQEKLKEGAK